MSLAIEYKGPINEHGDAGLYYSKYLNEEADAEYLVGTFFEPTDARRMFPSFDDPYFKAVFQLSVTFPNAAQIYGNMKDGYIHPYK